MLRNNALAFSYLIPESAVNLASKLDGEALSLDELDNFAPEDGMILVNTTSVGMKPNTNETPISKVNASLLCMFTLLLSC